jgi:hypothetical protein
MLVVLKRIAAITIILSGWTAVAQDSATLTVTVVDPSGAVVPGAQVVLKDAGRGSITRAETNETGFVVVNFLSPGDYSLEVTKAGFDKYRIETMVLKVRDRQTLHIGLAVTAAAGTSIQVTAESGTVSSDSGQGISVDQKYVENLPANGRNAESLILMAPGISTAAGGKGGGFNANGLRSNTNYYTLDGVSMNQPTSGGGAGGGPMRGGGGAPPMGGGAPSTDMISIDAMQEMKVQTSSFAPEFGRSPGAQIVMTSRGGTNQLHGTLSYYKRSDRFDANDWFANAGGYPKGKEKQDRPGAVLGGPITKDKTFFFLSFEELRLLAPQTVVATVPDETARSTAPAALQPYLNAFPLPNGAKLGSDAAEYRAVVSNPSRSHTESARIDHILSGKTTLFGRFSVTPSHSQSRGSDMSTPNVVMFQSSHSDQATAGFTHVFSGGELNDLRLNYSKSSSSGQSVMDNYGGAVPLTDSLVFPKGVTSATGSFGLSILGVSGYSFGGHSGNDQQQINVVDSLTKIRGTHNFKGGADYRRIRQTNYRTPYSVSASFDGITGYDESFLTGVALNSVVSSSLTEVYPSYVNLSLYGQDTWRATDRTTVTYGLRWDLNPAPSTWKGPKPFALSDSTIAGVTQNEPVYPTRWYDIAPRFGVAYLSDDTPGREMVLRAGIGVFYDMGYGAVDGAFTGAPYANVWTYSQINFPLSAGYLTAPTMPPVRPYGQITTGGTGLTSPRVYQWNGTWEKSFGTGQMLSVGVVGTRGRKLMRTETQGAASSDAYQVSRLVTNGAESDYNGLQIQFRKRLSRNFQAQLSYTWSHSIDSSSNDAGFGGFASLFGSGDRGPSDYDIRHNVSLSGSIRMPSLGEHVLLYPFRHWYLDFVASARSGLPFDIQGVSTDTSSSSNSSTSLFAQVRPNVVAGESIWIADSTVPGGRRLNQAAFEIPDGYAQGDLGRNALRGFSFAQLDLSIRRAIPVNERFELNISAEGYNILNHPNFANPTTSEGGNMSSPNFGVMTRMMYQSFGGGMSSLYRSGGPRSMELAVRLRF